MWFSKKKKNRRHRRRNVLDVKLRSDHLRAIRARGLAAMVGVLLGTVFVLYVLWRSGEWALDRLVYENPSFSIRAVDVRTDGQISVDQLRRWSGVQSGGNLMALDLARVKSNLELVPNVHSVSVERLLPKTLRIRVAERKPIARIYLPRVAENDEMVIQTWLLDLEGAVMMPLDPKYCQPALDLPDADLPVLIGVNPRELRLGRAVESGRLHTALRLVDAFNHSGMGSLVRLGRLDLTKSGVLTAVTDAGAQVTFGLEGFDQQLMRWHVIHERSLRLHKTILTLDLAVKDNVPVRWVDAI